MFSLYTLDILYNVTFFITLIYGWQIYSGSAAIRGNTKGIAFMFAVFAALMLGLYDIGYGYSGDRELYAYFFLQHVNSNISWNEILSNKEWAFYLYQNLTSFLEEPQYWFVLTAFIYVFNYYFVAKKIAPENTLLLFLAVVGLSLIHI